jgi:hypothetical protein
MKTMKTVMKKIFLPVLLAFGMALPACTPAAESPLASEESLSEGSKTRTPGKILVAGLVVGVRHQKTPPRLFLLLRETPVTLHGRPRCDVATGRPLFVDVGTPTVRVRTHREKSAFVVMGSLPDHSLASLESGMCLTVGDDTPERLHALPAPRIEILAPPTPAPHRLHLEGGVVTIWAGPLRKTRPHPTTVTRPAPSPVRGGTPKKAA